MNWLLLCRLLGLLGMLVGACMSLSLPWAFPIFGQVESFESRGFWSILGSIGCSLAFGGGLYLIGRKETSSILRREALAVVGLGWLLAGILGALPFLFSGSLRATGVPMHVADALFESISGFTTTGASVLTELEDPSYVPRCVMFWRSFTHWLGGMGIIVLFVAILGHLGAGGKALMRREVPGPISENVRPRIRETAMIMWAIYVGISALLTLVLLLEGMTFYNALCHSFGTMATGGFSTDNQSVGGFQSPLIEYTLVVFMLIAGTNFSLYYLMIKSPGVAPGEKRTPILHNLKPLYQDSEYRLYLSIIVVVTGILTANLMMNGLYPNFATAFRHGLFTTLAIITTTGFGTEDFTQWSEFAKGLLLMLMFVGGCAGSTGGGVKVIRYLLLFKIFRQEIEKSFRPNVVRPIRLAGHTIDDSHRINVLLYFCLILVICVVGWATLCAIEPDTQWYKEGHNKTEKLLDCASAVASSLNNIGPGIGVLGPHANYSDFSAQGKLLLTFLMLLGRLELFAVLVLLIPRFWKTQ